MLGVALVQADKAGKLKSGKSKKKVVNKKQVKRKKKEVIMIESLKSKWNALSVKKKTIAGVIALIIIIAIIS